jgi:hypothetical protein
MKDRKRDFSASRKKLPGKDSYFPTYPEFGFLVRIGLYYA